VGSGAERRRPLGVFSPRVFNSIGGILKVWDMENRRALCTLEGHTGAVTGVPLSRDGRLAFSASHDKTLKVWDLASGRELRTLKGHSDVVWGVAASGDGRLVASASQDKTVKVWDAESGGLLATFTCDSSPYCCVFSDGPKLIVAGGAGGRVHFLPLKNRKQKTDMGLGKCGRRDCEHLRRVVAYLVA
jgi:WD40 repeat protein